MTHLEQYLKIIAIVLFTIIGAVLILIGVNNVIFSDSTKLENYNNLGQQLRNKQLCNSENLNVCSVNHYARAKVTGTKLTFGNQTFDLSNIDSKDPFVNKIKDNIYVVSNLEKSDYSRMEMQTLTSSNTETCVDMIYSKPNTEFNILTKTIYPEAKAIITLFPCRENIEIKSIFLNNSLQFVL